MEFFGLTFVMFAGAVVLLLGIIILVITAFTTSVAWGLASFLIPPLAIGFALTHWSKAKSGFAITMIGAMVLGYGTWDNNRDIANQLAVQAQEKLRVDSENLLSNPQPSDTKEPFAVTVPPSQPPASTPTVLENKPEEVAPTIINIVDAHKFIGNEIRLTTTNGSVRVGVLAEVRKTGIVFEFKPKGVKTLIKTEINEDQVKLMELVH